MLGLLIQVWTIHAAEQKGTGTMPESNTGCGFSRQSRIFDVLKCAGCIGQPLPFFFFVNIIFLQGTRWSWKPWECPKKCREMVCFIFYSLWGSCNQHSTLYLLTVMSFLGNPGERRRWRTLSNRSPKPILLSGHPFRPHSPCLCNVTVQGNKSKWSALILG